MTGLRPNFAGYNDALGRAVRLGDSPAVAAGSDQAGMDAALDAATAEGSNVTATLPTPDNYQPAVTKPAMRKAAAAKVAALKDGPIEVDYKKTDWSTGGRKKMDAVATVDARVFYDADAPVGGEDPTQPESRYNNFVGSNYDSDRCVKDEADLTRRIMKQVMADPDGPLRYVSKVSIRSTHNSMRVEMNMSHEPHIGEDYPKAHKLEDYLPYQRWNADGHSRTGRHKNLTPEASEAMEATKDFLKTLNHDRSDVMTDYFDTSFYSNITMYGPDGPSWR